MTGISVTRRIKVKGKGNKFPESLRGKFLRKKKGTAQASTVRTKFTPWW